MTPYPKGPHSSERGLEIKTYVEQNNITDYVVIDDEEFSDFKTHLDMSRFIQTNFGDETTIGTSKVQNLRPEFNSRGYSIISKDPEVHITFVSGLEDIRNFIENEMDTYLKLKGN